jgi:dihydroorotate dehydrogenase electron transfer subunit
MTSLFHGKVRVLENVPCARDTFRIRLDAPELAHRIKPGQFLMLRLPGTSDPLLGRPFALYDVVVDGVGQPAAVDVVYLVVGKMTRILAGLGGEDSLDVWGPLGNGFPDLSGIPHVGLVAGGIGQTPFLAYTRQLLARGVPRVSLYYGVRTAELAACVGDFRMAGATVHLASDDGTLGFKGFVTQLLESHEPPDHLVGCGPEPMMKALAKLAQRWAKPCHLSLETPMACGVGICFSCVTRVRTEAGCDYRRVCVEGPVFDAATLDF